jgi:hypothetical protein
MPELPRAGDLLSWFDTLTGMVVDGVMDIVRDNFTGVTLCKTSLHDQKEYVTGCSQTGTPALSGTLQNNSRSGHFPILSGYGGAPVFLRRDRKTTGLFHPGILLRET